jgi:hypothetical protein
MPARLDLTPEQLLERIREQNRARVKRYRERRNATGNATPAPEKGPAPIAGNVTPSPPIPPVTPSSPIGEEEKVGRILAPFAGRGYVHSAEFWADMAASYPDVRLVIEARNVASWLKKPLKKNREAQCSEGFLINWMKKAQRDATAPPTARPMAYQTPSPGKPADPEPVLPDGATIQMVDRAHAQRALFDAKKLNLAEKLALARNGTNGRH